MLDLLHATSHIEKIRLTEDFRLDIRWWATYVSEWNGISVLYDLEWSASNGNIIGLETDACEYGGGAVCGTSWWSHTWTPEQLAQARNLDAEVANSGEPTPATTNTTNTNGKDPAEPRKNEKRRSMPFLQLLALTMAAATWGSRWKGKKIKFHNDCEPVVSAVNKGTSKSKLLMSLIRTLTYIAAWHEFEYKLIHIPGITNDSADALSRGDQDRFRSLNPNADSLPTIPSPLPIHNW
jgi:hypothetical protein